MKWNKMLTIATSQAEDLGYNIVDVIRVPGCMEIPLALDRVLSDEDIDGAFCLGIIEKGETDHGPCHGSRCCQNHPRIAIGSQQTNRFGNHWTWCFTRTCKSTNWPHATAAVDALRPFLDE